MNQIENLYKNENELSNNQKIEIEKLKKENSDLLEKLNQITNSYKKENELSKNQKIEIEKLKKDIIEL